jgi:hypothetical protein
VAILTKNKPFNVPGLQPFSWAGEIWVLSWNGDCGRWRALSWEGDDQQTEFKRA